MENDYHDEFDRLFARDLQRVGHDTRPNEMEWPALSARLDAANTRLPWYLALLWLLIPVLLVSNLWTLVHWQLLQAEIADLRQSQTLSTLAPASIVRYDTIYRTVIITRQEAAGKRPTVTSPTLSIGNGIGKGDDEAPAHVDPLGYLHQNIDSQLVVVKSNDRLIPVESSAAGDAAAPERQPVLLPDSAGVKRNPVAAPAPSDSLFTSKNLLQPHRDPLHWRLGAALDLLHRGAVDGLHISRYSAISVQGELLFGPNWGIASALSYGAYGYQTERDISPYVPSVAPMPPSPEYAFTHFEGYLRYFSPSLAVRYRFRPEKRCTFYLGLGYAAQFNLPGQVDCEYAQSATGEEFFYEIPVKLPNHLTIGLVQAGCEVRLHGRWMLFGETSGRFDPGQSTSVIPLLTGQIGLKAQIR